MKRAFREAIETIALTLIIFLLVHAVVQNFRVEQHSMEPTLQDGEYILVNKAAYWTLDTSFLVGIASAASPGEPQTVDVFGAPQRGDIVVFKLPQSPSRNLIKRVVGLPGEMVEIKERKVFINGKSLKEPYVVAPPNYYLSPRLIPPGHYFLLGDNRNNSYDSHSFGAVPRANIIGKAFLRYWPLEDFGLVPQVQ